MEQFSEISLSENVELAIIEDLIRQFKPFTDNDEHLEKLKELDEDFGEDLSKISYNDYFKHQGINYIKRNVKLNDPLMDLIFEKEAENIKTPLDEWNDKSFINNNLDLNI
jgi:hypothetical protein